MGRNVLLTLAAVSVLLLAYVATAATKSLRDRARVRRRIGVFSHLADTGDDAPVRVEAVASSVRTQSRTTFLDARYPLAGGVRTAVTAASFGVASATLVVAALLFFRVPAPVALVVTLVAGGLVALNVASTIEGRRRTAFEERFLIVAEDFQRMVDFGIAPPRAFSSVTEAAEEPVQSSLKNVVSSVDLGIPLAQALEAEARRVRIGELAMLAAILGTQAQVGGDLSEATANLASMLRERLDMRTRLRATTAESRLTLVILAAVPLVAIAMQWAFQPELFDTMIGESRHLLGIGLGLIVGGLLAARAMMRSVQP